MLALFFSTFLMRLCYRHCVLNAMISAPDCMSTKFLKWSYLHVTLEFSKLKDLSYLKVDFIEALTK